MIDTAKSGLQHVSLHFGEDLVEVYAKFQSDLGELKRK
jgi:hypothetical protein